ncbi:MAG: porin, partial [Spirochaetes bacterium]|nr:porin [Spirochaetota bacterium]
MQKFLVLLLVAAFAFISMPAMAQAPAADKSIDFYGQVYFWTGYEKNDKKVSNSANPDNPAKDAGYEQTDLSWKIEYPVTRFGARFKQGDFKANVEINTGDTDGKVMNYRQWWGEHTFTGLGGLRLLIGHTYAPTYVPAYVNDRGGLNGYAGSFTLTANRTSMIRLTMPAGPGNVMLAFIKPSETTPDGYSSTANYLQCPYPKIEAVYNLDMKAG